MYEIILFQGLFLAALVFVLGIDFWLEVLFLFRSIIVCILIGVIFGDIQIGLIIGGLIELVFVGLIFVGGVQSFNSIMAGLMIIVIVWFTGVDVKIVIGFGLSFSLLMQYVISFFFYVLIGALVIVIGMVMGNIVDYFNLFVFSMSNIFIFFNVGILIFIFFNVWLMEIVSLKTQLRFGFFLMVLAVVGLMFSYSLALFSAAMFIFGVVSGIIMSIGIFLVI